MFSSGIIPLMAILYTGMEMDSLPFQKLVNTTFSQQQYLLFSQQLPKGRCMNRLFSPLTQMKGRATEHQFKSDFSKLPAKKLTD